MTGFNRRLFKILDQNNFEYSYSNSTLFIKLHENYVMELKECLKYKDDTFYILNGIIKNDKGYYGSFMFNNIDEVVDTIINFNTDN